MAPANWTPGEDLASGPSRPGRTRAEGTVSACQGPAVRDAQGDPPERLGAAAGRADPSCSGQAQRIHLLQIKPRPLAMLCPS